METESSEFGRLPAAMVDAGILARMSGIEAKVWTVLVRHADFESRACFPAIDLVMKRTGLCRKSVTRAVAALAGMGAIAVTYRTHLGLQNLYTVYDSPRDNVSPTPRDNVSPTPRDNVSPTPRDNVSPTPRDNVSPTGGTPEVPPGGTAYVPLTQQGTNQTTTAGAAAAEMRLELSVEARAAVARLVEEGIPESKAVGLVQKSGADQVEVAIAIANRATKVKSRSGLIVAAMIDRWPPPPPTATGAPANGPSAFSRDVAREARRVADQIRDQKIAADAAELFEATDALEESVFQTMAERIIGRKPHLKPKDPAANYRRDRNLCRAVKTEAETVAVAYVEAMAGPEPGASAVACRRVTGIRVG